MESEESEPVDESDLKTLVRAFRASVAEDQERIYRQMDDLAHELRRRLTTSETAMLNALRDLTQRTSNRFTMVERDLAVIQQEIAEVKEDVGVVKGDVGQLASGMSDLVLAVARIEDALSR